MKATGKLACLAVLLAVGPGFGLDTGSPVEVPNPPYCSAAVCNVSSV